LAWYSHLRKCFEERWNFGEFVNEKAPIFEGLRGDSQLLIGFRVSWDSNFVYTSYWQSLDKYFEGRHEQ
jgi:hypothetical protein